MMKLNFVVTCTKQDLWFAKICIASIRYFYPENIIYLIKDNLLGSFSISELENVWNVKELKYGATEFGISASKMFFYADSIYENEFYLVLDSDIVLLGELPSINEDFDLAVSVERENNPHQEWVRDLYFDVDEVSKLGYHYPGYFFNAGQLICRRGFLNRNINTIKMYFDFDNLPRWTRLDILPKHDQSLLNYLLPKLETEGKLKIAKLDFMIWSRWEIAQKYSLNQIKNKYVPYLLHYAGDYRNQYLKKMTRPDILIFFRKFYFSKIPFGFAKIILQDISFGLKYYVITFLRFMKYNLYKKIF